jgi:hypothetical protein
VHQYGRGDQATSDFLKKCQRVGILRHVGRGSYSKSGPRRTDGVHGG